ncbi:MAG: hypothetical protein IPJ26_19890 [Bacteroidetes bacterium]|nr:hypothetical protein [Bacteroidota bacterium]
MNFFHVRRTTGSSPIKVTLSWGNSSEEIPLPSNLSVAGWNGSLWKNSGKSLTNGSVLMGEITAADSTVFSYYSVATTNSNLTLDSIQFNVLKEFSLFTNGILTTTPSINSNGKIGCSSIYGKH